MKNLFAGLTAGALVASLSLPVGAASVDVDLAGWQVYTEFGDPINSETFLNLGAGATITGFEYLGLSFTTAGDSLMNELVLSVNDMSAASYLDWNPATTALAGTFGPASGSWGDGDLGTRGGLFGPGASFQVADGNIWVTVYETADSPLGDPDAATLLDATIDAGTLRIHYTLAAVPEPASYGLMALGLLGLAAVVRRRR